MPKTALTFTVEDLLSWVDQATQELQSQSGDDHPLSSHFAFEMALAAGVCLAIPGARLVIISSQVSGQPTDHGCVAPQRFVAKFRNRLIGRGGLLDRTEVDSMMCEALRSEFEIRSIPVDQAIFAPHHRQLTPKEAAAFTTGTWSQFLGRSIAARMQAHLAALHLDRDTDPVLEQVKSPSRRI